VIWSLTVLAVVVAVAGGIAYWALDRYVIDHVEIEMSPPTSKRCPTSA
jgi:hypothetical protein